MSVVAAADVKRLGAVLAVWAHPDDETFVAGGLLAAAVQNGQRVVCVTATRGEKGQTPDESRWPSARIGDIRAKELAAALQLLGITEHHWLGYRDGHCATADHAAAAEKIAKLINTVRPKSIVTFGSDGLTGHPDHQTVSKWVDTAVRRTAPQPAVFHAVYEPKQYEQFLVPLDKQINLFFSIDKPPLEAAEDCAIALELPAPLLRQKLRALAAMPSQMERVLRAVPQADQEGAFGQECFVRATPGKV
ncbi:MAG: PIG-L deacetylase family protein [Candidatus Saccharimonadales bacterium]